MDNSKHIMFRLFQIPDFWQCITAHMVTNVEPHPCQSENKYFLIKLENAKSSLWFHNYDHDSSTMRDSVMYNINLIKYSSVDVFLKFINNITSSTTFETIFENALRCYRLDIVDVLFPVVVDLLSTGESVFTLQNLMHLCVRRGCRTVLNLMTKHLMPFVARRIRHEDIHAHIKSFMDKNREKIDRKFTKKKTSKIMGCHRGDLLNALLNFKDNVSCNKNHQINRTNLSTIFVYLIRSYFFNIGRFETKITCSCNNPDCTTDPTFPNAGKVRGIGNQIAFVRWILKHLHLTNLNVHNVINTIVKDSHMFLPTAILLCDLNYFTFDEMLGPHQQYRRYSFRISCRMIEYYAFHIGVPEHIRNKFHMYFFENRENPYTFLVQHALEHKNIRLLYRLHVHPYFRNMVSHIGQKNLLKTFLKPFAMNKISIAYDMFN